MQNAHGSKLRTPLLQADALCARVGSRTLFEGLSFLVETGSILSILGPNGAGKTTLLRILLGLRRAEAGRVIGGSAIGYVPQRSDTAFSYSAFEMVLMGRARQIRALSSPGKADHDHARRAMLRLGINHLATHGFDTLSGGERQLVLVARALVSQPTILVLDEPAAALDLRHQADILTLMRDLARDDGLGIIFTTHHPQHAAAISDQAVLIRDGQALTGDAATLLTEDHLTALYKVPVCRLATPGKIQGTNTLVALIEPAN